MTTIKKYTIPAENPLPDGHYCFPVYVPAEGAYLERFFWALDFFSKWVAWEETGDNMAKAVADRWKIANGLTREAFNAGGCDGMPEGVEFRYNDCTLEVYDPCDETWKPVTPGGASDDYDPNNDDPVEVPYPDPDPDPETGTACQAAANASANTFTVVNSLDQAYALSTIVFWIEITIVLWMAKLAKALAGRIWDISVWVGDYSYETFHSAFLAFDWDELKELLHCYYDDNGVMTEASLGELLLEIQSRIPDNLIWGLIALLYAGAGSVGMTRNGVSQGITDAECEECDPDWWDFEDEVPEYTIFKGTRTAGLGVDGSYGLIGEYFYDPSSENHHAKLAGIEVFVARAGTITAIEYTHKFDNEFPYVTPVVGISRGETTLYFDLAGVDSPADEWSTRSNSMSIAVEAGDKVTVYTGYNNHATEALALAASVAIDNIKIVPRDLFD